MRSRPPTALVRLPLACLLVAMPRVSGQTDPPDDLANAAVGDRLEIATLDATEDEIEVTDEEIEIFAAIYLELRETARRYERKIAAADSEREAQEVQTSLQKESFETLERHGWTAEKYDDVGRAVNRRPELVEKAMRLIEKGS